MAQMAALSMMMEPAVGMMMVTAMAVAKASVTVVVRARMVAMAMGMAMESVTALVMAKVGWAMKVTRQVTRLEKLAAEVKTSVALARVVMGSMASATMKRMATVLETLQAEVNS